MARLRNEDWLHLAKGTGIGSQRRVRHGNESSDALTVGNREDRWWAYCQRCKCGAVEMKSHVLAGSVAPALSTSLQHPTDARPISMLHDFERSYVASFLAGKHMDLTYFTLTSVTWSAERQRLLLATPSGVMGRDTSGRSSQKWLTYDRQHWVTDSLDATLPDVFLVEDCFSWAKVKYALQSNNIPASVFCTLGTAIHDNLFLHLMRYNKRVYSFYDGDTAGWSGAVKNEQRLYAMGLSPGRATQFQMCAPRDNDPKDMPIAAITQHVRDVLAISGG